MIYIGGTDIARALNDCTNIFDKKSNTHRYAKKGVSVNNENQYASLSRRIMFLTDLEDDGKQFVAVTKNNATKQIWMSIIGTHIYTHLSMYHTYYLYSSHRVRCRFSYV